MIPLLPLLIGCGTSPPPEVIPPAPPARHALVIVIDTLRDDAARVAFTPNMDALAEAGARAPLAWSAGTWTVPSVISMLTGLPVAAHGWDEPTGKLGRYPALPPAELLAERLSAAGFATDGLYANPYLAEDLGFDRGFDSWKRSADAAMPKQFARKVAEGWSDGRRHFAYLHLIGPHSPLRPSDDAQQRQDVAPRWFDDKRGLVIGVAKRNREDGAREAYTRGYRAVIEDTDERVGALLEALGPHRRDTVVLLVSDHGEMLGEHDIVGHGHWVWEPLTRVPLIVDRPGVVDPPLPPQIGITSVPALITEALGLDGAWPTPARPDRGPDDRPLSTQREGQVALLLANQTKAIWAANGDGPQLFDLRTDPGEAIPLADSDGRAATALAAWRASLPAALPPAAEVQLDAERVEELRQLGYLDASPPVSPPQ